MNSENIQGLKPYCTGNILYISVCNLDEFNKLLRETREAANVLNEKLFKLSTFDIKIEISDGNQIEISDGKQNVIE